LCWGYTVAFTKVLTIPGIFPRYSELCLIKGSTLSKQ
jgi:hypothetical protein